MAPSRRIRHRSEALPNAVAALPATRLTPDVATRSRTLFGRVRSVHRAAVYVDVGPPNGLLIFAIDDVGGLPGGMLLGGLADLRATGIERGMALLPSAGGWAIPSASVAIDASTARIWSPALPAAARVTANRRSIEAARAIAADLAPAGGLGPLLTGGDRPADPWLGVARALIGRQLEALRAVDVASALGPTVDLVGLGTGLTPSGDDYLVGMLAGLEATGHPAHRPIAAAIAASAAGRTTAIGAAMLAHAARGAFTERLHDVLVALAIGRPDGLRTAMARAMAYGATSGSDTLVGLFGALDIATLRRAGARRAGRSRVAA